VAPKLKALSQAFGKVRCLDKVMPHEFDRAGGLERGFRPQELVFVGLPGSFYPCFGNYEA
jgi:hypothetical protein